MFRTGQPEEGGQMAACPGARGSVGSGSGPPVGTVLGPTVTPGPQFMIKCSKIDCGDT